MQIELYSPTLLKNQSLIPFKIPDVTQLQHSIRQKVLTLTNQTPMKVEDFLKGKTNALFYINPLSVRSVLWNLLIIIIVYILVIQVSLVLAFGPQFLAQQVSQTWFMIVLYVFVFLLLVDMIFNFHKGYYSFGQGRVVDDPIKIALKYLKSHFFIDLMCIIVLILLGVINTFNANWIQFIPCIFLWFKKFQYHNQIILFLQNHKYVQMFWILLILMIDVLIVGHFGACLAAGIDLLLWNSLYYGTNTSYYWLSNDSEYSINLLQQGSWGLQYTYAQSFSTGTLSTLAPGPFMKNPIQVIFAIFVMIFFMLLASYVGQVLISLLYVDEQKRVFHENNIQKFDIFMQLKQVSQTIKDRVHNFFQLIWQTQVKMDTKEKNYIIGRLPPVIRQKLLLEMSFGKYIVFLNNLPNYDYLLGVIATKIVQVVLDSQTSIFQSKIENYEMYNRQLYYIKEGLAKFYLPKSQVLGYQQQYIIGLSNLQRLLGSYQFVTGQMYSYCCKAVDLCIVNKLAYKDFKKIYLESDMMEEFKELKQAILINRQYDKIGKVCLICLQEHLQSNCPDLYCNIAIENNIKQLGYTVPMKRKQSKRKSINSKKVSNLKIPQKFQAISNAMKIFGDINNFQKIFMGKEQVSIDLVTSYNKYQPSFNIKE